MDKMLLKDLKPGDKFTIELTVKTVNNTSTSTVSGDTVAFVQPQREYFKTWMNYDLIAITPAPRSIEVGCKAHYTNTEYGPSVSVIALFEAEGVPMMVVQIEGIPDLKIRKVEDYTRVD